VRYVMEGSVRRAAGRIRVNAQLIDAETGNHIWAERYDRVLEDVFSVQDEIADALMTAINPAVAEAELRRALHKPPENLGAWEAYQRGLWHLYQGTQDDNEHARRYFRQAIVGDPKLSVAHVGIMRTYMFEVTRYGTTTRAAAAALMHDAARAAVATDPGYSDAHAAIADVFINRGDFDAAAASLERAIALNPNSPYAPHMMALVLLSRGQTVAARKEASTSVRLNPNHASRVNAANVIATLYYHEYNYLAALEAARRCKADDQHYIVSRRILVAALGQLGQYSEAQAELREWLTLAPGTLQTFIFNRPPWIRSEDHEHLLQGLRKAGWDG
jgi:adenylate cyclase